MSAVVLEEVMMGEGAVRTYHVRTSVLLGKNLASTMRGNLEVWDNGDGLDLLGPGELDVMSDTDGRVRGLLARVLSSGRRREDLAQGDLCSGNVLGCQGLEIGSDKASVECSSDIVRMSL